MDRIILHIDFNSYFATVEQQANPRLRGKPIGVTGGDRIERTVLGAASVEAKKLGVKTGMTIPEAKKLCPEIILVRGDSDKYLAVTQKFLNILKDYSPYLEVFSIDEVFMELSNFARGPVGLYPQSMSSLASLAAGTHWGSPAPATPRFKSPLETALDIKKRIKAEIGEWISCSIGISYNKLMAKLAGSLYKPDGLVVIEDEQAAQMILDQIELDEICGIGPRVKARLNNLGVTNFKQLRAVPVENLLASFKSYGQILYNMARGIDETPVVPFYERAEVKSVGHRHTIDHDTDDLVEIKQILLKLTELVGRRLRAKKLVGKTIHCWYRSAHLPGVASVHLEGVFVGDGMQLTIINPTNDGLEIFQAAWKIFSQIWDQGRIRMIGTAVSNLKSTTPANLTLLDDHSRQEKIVQTLDKINDKFGEFTLQRGILLGSAKIYRKPNPYLADRRFKL